MLALLLAGFVIGADDMPWQDGCGWIDVRAAGAVGDGRQEDHAAITAAVADIKDGGATVYLRDGTYQLGDTVQLPSKRLVLQGQSRARTVLRLKDNAPGFGDAAKPKPVVAFIAYTANGLPPNFPKNRGMGQAFCNGLYDLTIEVGAGNPGAIACYFITNNQGGVENVTLRSAAGSGHKGLAMDYAWCGPGLVSNLLVEGFDIGINLGQNQYSMVFDHIALKGQRHAGFVNAGNLARIARLTSDNSVPAIRNSGFSGSLILIDSVLKGTGPAAIINHGTLTNKYGPSPDCWLPAAWLRDVRVEGYAAAVDSRWTGGSESVPAGPAIRWTSHPSQRFDGPGVVKGLDLRLSDPPSVPEDAVADWASIAAFGAETLASSQEARRVAREAAKAKLAAAKQAKQPPPEGADPDAAAAAIPLADATAAIQAAIDSGATTVRFPRGLYRVTDTIIIRGKVRRVFGGDGALRPEGFKDTDKPLFRITGDQPTVVFERLNDSYGDCKVWFQHEAATTLVLRRGILSGYRNTVPGSKLFVEDVCGGNWHLDRVDAVGRQWNSEVKAKSGLVNIRQRGGTLAILGYKTEYGMTVLDADEGARAEVLGSYNYHGSELPCYLLGDARLSLVGLVTHEGYTPMVLQQRDGQRRQLSWAPYHPVSNKTPAIPGLVRIYGQHVPWFSTETP